MAQPNLFQNLATASDEDNEQPGVEQEPDEAGLPIVKPFEPEKIKVRTATVVVELIVSRIKHGEIDLAPDFQRLRGVWDNKRKSRFIESLLLRIPVPVFYVAEDTNENWSVVDGLQRLSTISDFVDGKFSLSDLEYLGMEGTLFSGLPRPMQRRINETQLVVNIIEPGTPEEVMFNIFSRINTGGLRLNGQEIRHALNKGPARQYLKDLASSAPFQRATAGSVKPMRMADRECALRFLAFYMTPWEEYSTNDLDTFLGRAMRRLNDMSAREREALRVAFDRALDAAWQIFGEDAFRKRYHPNDQRRPVSKALFESWTVELARLSATELADLVIKAPIVRASFVELMNADRDFEVAISYSTGVPQRVHTRFASIRNLVSLSLHA